MYSYRHNLPGTICRRISRVPLSDYKVFLLRNLSFLKQYCKDPLADGDLPVAREILRDPAGPAGQRRNDGTGQCAGISCHKKRR